MLTVEYINIAPNKIISIKRGLEALKICKRKAKCNMLVIFTNAREFLLINFIEL